MRVLEAAPMGPLRQSAHPARTRLTRLLLRSQLARGVWPPCPGQQLRWRRTRGRPVPRLRPVAPQHRLPRRRRQHELRGRAGPRCGCGRAVRRCARAARQKRRHARRRSRCVSCASQRSTRRPPGAFCGQWPLRARPRRCRRRHHHRQSGFSGICRSLSRCSPRIASPCL